MIVDVGFINFEVNFVFLVFVGLEFDFIYETKKNAVKILLLIISIKYLYLRIDNIELGFWILLIETPFGTEITREIDMLLLGRLREWKM